MGRLYPRVPGDQYFRPGSVRRRTGRAREALGRALLALSLPFRRPDGRTWGWGRSPACRAAHVHADLGRTRPCARRLRAAPHLAPGGTSPPMRTRHAAALAVVLAMILSACSSGAGPGWTYAPTPPPTPVPSGAKTSSAGTRAAEIGMYVRGPARRGSAPPPGPAVGPSKG